MRGLSTVIANRYIVTFLLVHARVTVDVSVWLDGCLGDYI